MRTRALSAIHLFVLRVVAALVARHDRIRARPEAGQATAEYALVLLGAAAVALLLLAWATKSGEIEKLLNAVFDALVSKVR